jgi:Flp pilus assembly protein TadB
MPFLTAPRPSARRGGFVGEMIRWFIMVAIYDLVITGLAEMLGVSRLVAIFIFLGLLFLFGFIAYVMRQNASARVDEH